jgi:hypothetical protein
MKGGEDLWLTLHITRWDFGLMRIVPRSSSASSAVSASVSIRLAVERIASLFQGSDEKIRYCDLIAAAARVAPAVVTDGMAAGTVVSRLKKFVA